MKRVQKIWEGRIIIRPYERHGLFAYAQSDKCWKDVTVKGRIAIRPYKGMDSSPTLRVTNAGRAIRPYKRHKVD
ncbi:MAG: hypothetical protein HGB11_06065 [Chlorobiales bacterium]|nr:hypothetical protein [Chlorobiales bacterium]